MVEKSPQPSIWKHWSTVWQQIKWQENHSRRWFISCVTIPGPPSAIVSVLRGHKQTPLCSHVGFSMKSRSFWWQRCGWDPSSEPLVLCVVFLHLHPLEPVLLLTWARGPGADRGHLCSVKVNQNSWWPFYCWGSAEAASKAGDRKKETQHFQLSHGIYPGKIFCHDSQRPSAGVVISVIWGSI